MKSEIKATFRNDLIELVNQLNDYVEIPNGQWTIKGFLDVFQNIYTISADTKIVSKILEIHIFPIFVAEKWEIASDSSGTWAKKFLTIIG